MQLEYLGKYYTIGIYTCINNVLFIQKKKIKKEKPHGCYFWVVSSM